MSLPAALNYYWMGGEPSGGGTPSADFDGLEFPLVGNPSQNSGALSFTLASDGTWTCPVAHYIGVESGNWFLPTTPGAGADYEVRFSYSNSGNPNADTLNGAPDWTSLATPIGFIVSLTGDFQDEGWTVICEIRDAVSHVVVTGGTFVMSITLT